MCHKQVYRKEGFTGIKEKLGRELNNWTTIPLYSAVVGNAGTGKSSFINAIRGLKAKQPGAAEVGVSETTAKCQPYTHPDNKNFIVWDLPGVGTPTHPKATYLNAVEYDKYDFFIIMSRSRFTENDLWLAREVQERNKTFFFVRSNIDTDIENDKADNPDNHDENRLLQTIREKTAEQLKKNEVKEPKVYLINNRQKETFDFGKLTDDILSSCNDGLKKDAIVLSLAAVTKTVIAEKERVLRARIPMVALEVVSCSGKSEQTQRFQDEIQFYQKQFCIDDVTIAENKDIWTLSDESVKEFQVTYDQYGVDGKLSLETPFTMKAETSIWKRVADLFKLSNEKKLIYAYCEIALEKNLGILHKKAYNLYTLPRAKQLVHAVCQEEDL